LIPVHTSRNSKSSPEVYKKLLKEKLLKNNKFNRKSNKETEKVKDVYWNNLFKNPETRKTKLSIEICILWVLLRLTDMAL